RKRQHPASADATEEDWRIDHRRGPIRCRAAWPEQPRMFANVRTDGAERLRKLPKLRVLRVRAREERAINFVGVAGIQRLIRECEAQTASCRTGFFVRRIAAGIRRSRNCR